MSQLHLDDSAAGDPNSLEAEGGEDQDQREVGNDDPNADGNNDPQYQAKFELIHQLVDEDDGMTPTVDVDKVANESAPGSRKSSGGESDFELADIVEIKMASLHEPESSNSLKRELASLASDGEYSDSAILQTAQLAKDAKNDRIASKVAKADERAGDGKGRHNPSPSLAIDDDIMYVDKILIRTGYAVVLTWIGLLLVSYLVTPSDSIQYYEGTERNAALVELSILGTAFFMKHFPLLWDADLMGMSAPSSSSDEVGGKIRWGKDGTISDGRTRISGILLGGMVTQLVALTTCVIMVCFPVPVLEDPVLGNRVHLIRWCEWTPLAGFMTLLTECIDAPNYDGEKLAHPWKKKFAVSSLQTLSTFCGLLFPFCTNIYVWSFVMAFSCVTYSAIIFRYVEKRNLFRTCIWRGGGSVDEMELFERSRMSLSLHGVCAVVWSVITVNYFVVAVGPLLVSPSWKIIHDPSIAMIGECLMDLLAKCLYMALIIEVHDTAFDEAKRANRRLAELRNTMSVVWEHSSDTIAISVQKVSGNITSMVSPSFFRPALLARQENIDDISAIILDHKSSAVKKYGVDSKANTNTSKAKEEELPDVGLKIIRKADFASVDIHTAGDNAAFESLKGKNECMSSLMIALTDMLARAWQSQSKEEFLFEHDTASADSLGTKYEVKVTRLEKNTIVVVVRNVSERYRRFEAEKRFVFETTARQKDAEANRFTRHEVKNGLLAAIEMSGNIREEMAVDFSLLQQGSEGIADTAVAEQSMSGRMDSMAELDRTLHEVLDLVLAETMARDVIHEMYVPRVERVDVNHIFAQTRGFNANEGQFSVVCNPSPLPIFLADQGLFKCIHGNAIRNALKYGQPGGRITTEATYNSDSGELETKVINLPGPGHDQLVKLGERATELVFAQGTRLHKDLDKSRRRTHSAGDGAWIIHKCATILGGTVSISFDDEQTVFTFKTPIQVHSTPTPGIDTFKLPQGVWGIGIDDSKIQRKLLRRFLHHVGIDEQRQIILGQKSSEIDGFVDFVVDFMNRHPGDQVFLIADENLERNADAANHDMVSGSECIKEIRNRIDSEQEQQLLALVRSANDSPKDLALYRSRAHGYMPKVPLRGLNVKEMVAPLWNERFSLEKRVKDVGDGLASESSSSFHRISSIDNLQDLTLISPIELLAQTEQIDAICVREYTSQDRWPLLVDKLHQLKGDLMSVNVDDKLSSTINLIEGLMGGDQPSNFMTIWLRIRSDIIAFISRR